MTLGSRLRKLRKDMKLSQGKLAELAGVTQPTISDYERGITQNHRADELMRIAAVLRTTPDYLKHGTGASNIDNATTAESALLAAFNALGNDSRAALIAAAQAMAPSKK